MENNKIDRRVKYTKMVLRQSLLELLKERSINKITVKDLCQLADVNRGTFYAHFSDPYDLLKQIENELFLQVKEALEKHQQPVMQEGVSALVLELVQCIADNKDLCQIVLGEYGNPEFLKQVLDLAHEKCVAEWSKQLSQQDRFLVEYLYAFTAKGSIGLIQQWICSGMKESPQQVADIISKASYDGLQAFFSE